MPTLKNRQRVGLGDFSGVRRQQPMRQNGCSLTRLFLAGILSQLYELYADLSSKMMDVIGRFSPEQYVYSIDESFLSFHRCFPAIKDLREHGSLIRRAVWKECRLPVCIGMGTTLTLAKIANHAAKKIQGCKGVCVIDNEHQRTSILKQLEVGDVWGVGKKISTRLKHMGINSAYDLSQYAPEQARREFSVEIERTVRELNGVACKGWDTARADKSRFTQLVVLEQESPTLNY